MYQSPLFGPVTTGVISGGVLSRRIVTEVVDVPPRFVAVHVNVVPAVSVETTAVSQPLLASIGTSRRHSPSM